MKRPDMIMKDFLFSFSFLLSFCFHLLSFSPPSKTKSILFDAGSFFYFPPNQNKQKPSGSFGSVVVIIHFYLFMFKNCVLFFIIDGGRMKAAIGQFIDHPSNSLPSLPLLHKANWTVETQQVVELLMKEGIISTKWTEAVISMVWLISMA